MTPDRLAELTTLRQHLHMFPDVSGSEEKTASFVAEYLSRFEPDRLLTGLGGYGVAAVFEGHAPGPCLMFRAELDGLPIAEHSDKPYRSRVQGRGHLCGHDGHMTMVLALADELAQNRPTRGRVVLLFQPAEETGKGAAAVLADTEFGELAPDYAFALHNVPGLAQGQVALSRGAANCASRGARIRLTGRTSHAAAPQDGVSPAGAVAQLMADFVALGAAHDADTVLDQNYRLVTLTHVSMGEATFGIAPGDAELWVTLRTVSDAAMTGLMEEIQLLVSHQAASWQLGSTIEFDDVFAASHNNSEASRILETAAKTAGYEVHIQRSPQRWSEDFGQFSTLSKSTMFWLGSGEHQPQLHNPDYDFPDAILPIGVEIFSQIITDVLNS